MNAEVASLNVGATFSLGKNVGTPVQVKGRVDVNTRVREINLELLSQRRL